MIEQPAEHTPAVSVVMPVIHPDPAYLRQAIESVLQQTLTDVEIVIVEDPSSCPTGELLAEFSDPRIRHIINPVRTSFAASVNRGLAESRSSLVARFDGDDICGPDRLRKQIRFLQAHPEVDVLGSHLEVIDPAGRTLGYRDYPLDHESIFKAMPRFSPLAHPAVMYRKEAVLKAGGYRVAKYPGTEDYELWSRLAKAGLRFANYPEALVRYRVHPGATKATKLRSSLLATLEVKRTYWSEGMDLGARARMWAEKLLLWLPPGVVMRLFMATQFRRTRPA